LPAGVPDVVVVRVIRKSLPTTVLEVARDQLVEPLLGRDVAGIRRMVADLVVVAQFVGPESGELVAGVHRVAVLGADAVGHTNTISLCMSCDVMARAVMATLVRVAAFGSRLSSANLLGVAMLVARTYLCVTESSGEYCACVCVLWCVESKGYCVLY
jgi:hypothetical protein